MGKPVAVDSDELALLRAGHKMMDQLFADPEKGVEFKKQIKAKYPNVSIPDLDAMSAVEKMLEPIKKRLDDRDAEEKKSREDSQVRDLQSRFDRIAKDHGLTQEGQQKLLGIMKDRSIGNPEDAIVIFNKDLPKAGKAKPYTSRMSFVEADGEKDADFNKLMTDPDAFMIDGMVGAFEEMRKEKE